MGCEEANGGAIVCLPPSDEVGSVWWDGGGGLWIWNWGPIADWATVAVATVAVLAAWKASTRSHGLQSDLNRLEQERESRAEVERERRLEADERGAQADLVASWIAKSEPETSSGGRPVWEWVVVVNNGSPLPVYNVRVSVVGPAISGYERFDQSIAVLPPGRTELPLGKVDLIPMTFQGPDGEPEEIEETVEDLMARMSFRDTAGRFWVRAEDGELVSRGRRIKMQVDAVGMMEGVLRKASE